MQSNFKFKVNGSTARNEFVICFKCKKPFSWLKARQYEDGKFVVICRKCRMKI